MLTVGVDGCPAGWLAVTALATDGCPDRSGMSLSWAIHDTFGSLLDSELKGKAAMIVVDMPIGLSDGPPRACDRAARLRLGPRRSSVFSPPMRAMLAMASQREATAHGRSIRPSGGLSVQAWNIVPKIKEADAAMTPDHQAMVREGHPELAFTRLGGAPMRANKKTEAGRAERLAVLAANGLDAAPLCAAVAQLRPRPAAMDDVLDACVLSLTARDAVAGRAWVLGGERDRRGLRMEILG